MGVNIYSLTLSLEGEGVFPKYTGYMARGMFLNMIKKNDPKLSASLHDQKFKMYSISSFRRMKRATGDLGSLLFKLKGKEILGKLSNKINEGDLFGITIVSADDNLNSKYPELFNQNWLPDKDNFILKPIGLETKTFDPTTSPHLPNPINLRFYSPVAFSRGKYISVFPDADYLFNNLLTIWNKWIPEHALPEELLRKKNNTINISGARGTVVSRSSSGKTSKGWIGNVSYHFPDESHHELASHLLKLGKYSGIGRKRTAGLGRFTFYNRK